MPGPSLTFADALRLPWRMDSRSLSYVIDLPRLSESQRKAVVQTLEKNGITAYDFGDTINIPPGENYENTRLASGMRDLLDIANLNWKKEYSREKFQDVWRIDVSHVSEADQHRIIQRLKNMAGVNAHNFTPIFGSSNFIDVPADAVLGGNLFQDSLYRRSFSDIRHAFEEGVEVDKPLTLWEPRRNDAGRYMEIDISHYSAPEIDSLGHKIAGEGYHYVVEGASGGGRRIRVYESQNTTNYPDFDKHVRFNVDLNSPDATITDLERLQNLQGRAESLEQKWNNRRGQIEVVRELEEHTVNMAARNLPDEGYNTHLAVEGYAALVDAYALTNNRLTEEQHKKIDRTLSVLNELEADKVYSLANQRLSPEVKQEVVSQKMQQLEKYGVTYMVSGHSQHANVVKIEKTSTGYVYALYDAGGETRSLGIRQGRHIVAAVQEYRVNSNEPIENLIGVLIDKKSANYKGQEYAQMRQYLDKAMDTEHPVRLVEDYAQARGNCTTRGQRTLIKDMLRDDALAADLHEFVRNPNVKNRDIVQKIQDRRASIGREIELLHQRPAQVQDYGQQPAELARLDVLLQTHIAKNRFNEISTNNGLGYQFHGAPEELAELQAELQKRGIQSVIEGTDGQWGEGLRIKTDSIAAAMPLIEQAHKEIYNIVLEDPARNFRRLPLVVQEQMLRSHPHLLDHADFVKLSVADISKLTTIAVTADPRAINHAPLLFVHEQITNNPGLIAHLNPEHLEVYTQGKANLEAEWAALRDANNNRGTTQTQAQGGVTATQATADVTYTSTVNGTETGMHANGASSFVESSTGTSMGNGSATSTYVGASTTIDTSTTGANVSANPYTQVLLDYIDSAEFDPRGLRARVTRLSDAEMHHLDPKGVIYKMLAAKSTGPTDPYAKAMDRINSASGNAHSRASEVKPRSMEDLLASLEYEKHYDKDGPGRKLEGIVINSNGMTGTQFHELSVDLERTHGIKLGRILRSVGNTYALDASYATKFDEVVSAAKVKFEHQKKQAEIARILAEQEAEKAAQLDAPEVENPEPTEAVEPKAAASEAYQTSEAVVSTSNILTTGLNVQAGQHQQPQPETFVAERLSQPFTFSEHVLKQPWEVADIETFGGKVMVLDVSNMHSKTLLAFKEDFDNAGAYAGLENGTDGGRYLIVPLNEKFGPLNQSNLLLQTEIETSRAQVGVTTTQAPNDARDTSTVSGTTTEAGTISNSGFVDSEGATTTTSYTNTVGGDGIAITTSTVTIEEANVVDQTITSSATNNDAVIADETLDLGPSTLSQTTSDLAESANNYINQNDVAVQSATDGMVGEADAATGTAGNTEFVDGTGATTDVVVSNDVTAADVEVGAVASEGSTTVEVANAESSALGTNTSNNGFVHAASATTTDVVAVEAEPVEAPVNGSEPGNPEYANDQAQEPEHARNDPPVNTLDDNSGQSQSATDIGHPANTNTVDTGTHDNSHVPDAPHVGTHVVGVASTAMSVLGVKDIMQRMENGEKVETHEVLAAGLGATDGLAGAMKLGLDDLAAAAAQGTKLANGAKALGKFGIIGSVITAAPDLYHAHAEGNVADKGAAYGQLGGGVAVTVVGSVLGASAGPLVLVAIPVVEACQTVGRPLGQLFSDDPKEVAAGKKELNEIGERYGRPGTGQVDLAAQAVRSIGGAAKGLGDGVGWLGDKSHAFGDMADEYIKNSNLVEPFKTAARAMNSSLITAPAVVLQVAGRTVQAAGAIVETYGHATSRVADEMGKAIKEEVAKEGLLKGTVTGVAKGAAVVYEKASPYMDKKIEEVKSAYAEYMPTWLGGDEPKPEVKAPAKPAAAPAAPKKSNLQEKQAEAQLAKLAIELEGKGYKGRLDLDHDGKIEVDEIRAALKKNGVTSMASLDVNANGNISGKELSDVLLKPPVTANAKPKEVVAR